MVNCRRLIRRIRHFSESISILGIFYLVFVIIAILAIIIAIIIGVVHLIKYLISPNILCFPELCNPNPNETSIIALGCLETPANFSENCTSPTQINFTNILKRTLLDNINNYRNAYAGNMMGRSYYPNDVNSQSGGYSMCDVYKPTDRPPCGRCAIIQWDNDLAALGELATKSCKIGITYCAKTVTYPNPAMLEVLAPVQRFSYFLSQVVKQWSYIDNRYNVTAEYFLLTHEKQTHIGCGMALMGNKSKEMIYLACFFSYKVNITVYLRDGPNFVDRGGSRCTTGTDFRYRSLCTPDEEIVSLPGRTTTFMGLNDSNVPYGRIYAESLA